MIHVDFAPVEGCKHPEWTHGEICVKCNECGRFDYKPKTEMWIIAQSHDGYPPLWRYPDHFGGYFKSQDGKCECWFRSNKPIKHGTALSDIIPECWYPKPLEGLRWWLEGRNY